MQARDGVEWLGCWAHARRCFFEAAAERPRTAERVLRLIGNLYALEAEWDEAKVGDRRAALRQAHFAAPLRRQHWLVTALRARVLPKSGLGQACAYLLGRWITLTDHLRHSHTRLDTNAVEIAVRPSKLGAKNWLFIGTPTPVITTRCSTRWSSPASAVATTLTPTCAMCSVACRP